MLSGFSLPTRPSPFAHLIPPKCPPEAWEKLFERYPAIRSADAPFLMPGTLREYSPRTRHREAQAVIDAGLATRMRVLHRDVLVGRAAEKREATLVHHIQRGMLDAALVQDGFTTSSDEPGLQALRTWLLAQPPAPGEDPRFVFVARERIALMSFSGPLPYTVAWRGPVTAPTDLRLSVVLHPGRKMKEQLEELPLRHAGQPKVPVILRPADDGTTYCRHQGKLINKWRRYNELQDAFREHHRKYLGMFPYHLTSTVLDYRPDLWVRAQNR